METKEPVIAEHSQGDNHRPPVAASVLAGETLHDFVVAEVRDMIVGGELAGGSHIPERAICERLQISRTPLREAYKVLASEGLLTLQRNRGAIITRLSLQDVEDAMEVLGALEALAAEHLCARITDAGILEIEEIHKKMVAHYRAGERLDYFKANQSIHNAIVENSGNHILAQTHHQIGNRVRRFRFAGNQEPSRWDRAVKEHEQILWSIQDRDGSLLSQILRRHIRNGWVIVKDRFRDELGSEDASPPKRRRARRAKAG